MTRWLASVVGALTAEQWQAVGSIGTLVVAIAAAVFAYFQVREARRTREDQARPYVVAFLEMDGFSIDLVVKNFGTTVARNVTMVSDQKMCRVRSPDNAVDTIDTFDALPVLVPGQEWRTWFDVGRELVGSGHPVYTVTVTYADARGRSLPVDTFRLDWHQFESIIFSTKKDVDDIAKSLDKIASVADRWTEGSKGLSVYTRSGEARDRAIAERREERRIQQAINLEHSVETLREAAGDQPRVES